MLSADPVARAQISAQTPCPSAPESCPCEHGLRAEYFFLLVFILKRKFLHVTYNVRNFLADLAVFD